jgi:hypothetical protein
VGQGGAAGLLVVELAAEPEPHAAVGAPNWLRFTVENADAHPSNGNAVRWSRRLDEVVRLVPHPPPDPVRHRVSIYGSQSAHVAEQPAQLSTGRPYRLWTLNKNLAATDVDNQIAFPNRQNAELRADTRGQLRQVDRLGT